MMIKKKIYISAHEGIEKKSLFLNIRGTVQRREEFYSCSLELKAMYLSTYTLVTRFGLLVKFKGRSFEKKETVKFIWYIREHGRGSTKQSSKRQLRFLLYNIYIYIYFDQQGRELDFKNLIDSRFHVLPIFKDQTCST